MLERARQQASETLPEPSKGRQEGDKSVTAIVPATSGPASARAGHLRLNLSALNASGSSASDSSFDQQQGQSLAAIQLEKRESSTRITSMLAASAASALAAATQLVADTKRGLCAGFQWRVFPKPNTVRLPTCAFSLRS